MLKRARFAGLALVVGLVLTSCDEPSPVKRPSQPAVMTGADLPDLVGEVPGHIVAFRFQRSSSQAPRWVQIPVQVDERAMVPFGGRPATNSTPGTMGTVYGNGTGGPEVLQYTDPNTFVGADPDPLFDADDELVFMLSDSGSRVDRYEAAEPVGVLAGSGIEVQITDPLVPGTSGWVYLFLIDEMTPAEDFPHPSAGDDYVQYYFTLLSGDYRTTYKRMGGSNPEWSTVYGQSYRAVFTDRWFETDWRIGDGPNLIDGLKNMYVVGNCTRSNLTFSTGGGAFVANIDGPVRAIRSYIGANSGPLTQRTHLMYRDHEEIVTDLRVHAIPAMMDIVDYSTEAVGMTYRNSANPDGVTIDGVADAITADVADWEAVHGPQGTVITTNRITTTIPGLPMSWWYSDDAPSSVHQCWGDDGFRGASGLFVNGVIPNTDLIGPGVPTLRGTRVVRFLPPTTEGELVNSIAQDLGHQDDVPVQLTTERFYP